MTGLRCRPRTFFGTGLTMETSRRPRHCAGAGVARRRPWRFAMNTPRSLSALAALAGLFVAAPGLAQMTPLEDLRQVNANAHYGGLTDARSESPPGFFASW